MRAVWAAIRVGLLDLRGDARRFILLIACLAVGTALIAGVSSVGASIAHAIDASAAELMGGDLELSRADRPATDAEIRGMTEFGAVSGVVDTNVRAESATGDAFVDLRVVDGAYPLVGHMESSALPPGQSIAEALGERDGAYGALLDPLMLDQLKIAVGDSFQLGGTMFQVRGTLTKLPDSPVRGFRLGLTTVIGADGFAALSDRTSPLPGLGSWFRYKILLDGGDAETAKPAVEAAFADTGWTVRSARDGLGPMVRYYDLFMRFLVIVGLGSLVIGGVSVWTGMQAYIAERANVIAILRSMGADRWRVFVHFFAQIAMLAAIGVGIGVLVGAATAFFILPMVGEAVGVSLAPAVHLSPLLVAAGAGFVTAFGFSYLPLQQAQAIRPVHLFRSKGLSAPPVDWRTLLTSWQVLPLFVAAIAFLLLALAMTGDPLLVAAFAGASVLAAVVFQLFIGGVRLVLRRLPNPPTRILRHALRAVSSTGSNAAAVVVSAGMALTMLIVVLVLQGNLRQEFLGASAFDVPTLVASDLFPDEVEKLETMSGPGTPITKFVATPMLRGALTQINGVPADSVRTRGPEATFLLSGEVPLTFRT
ncbi:MAG TPA: FtsX-like permease family protein, partial [Devosia sp.]|nr:FtsX-like permease family protein [Devosia sp.]